MLRVTEHGLTDHQRSMVDLEASGPAFCVLVLAQLDFLQDTSWVLYLYVKEISGVSQIKHQSMEVL